MIVRPNDIMPSQDFLKEQTLKHIGACIREERFDDLPPTPIVRKDIDGKLIAIDGHNLIAAKSWLGEDVDVHLAESADDGLINDSESSQKRNEDLKEKFEIVLDDVKILRQNGIQSFEDICHRYESILKHELSERGKAMDHYWTDKRKAYEKSEGAVPSIFAEFAITYFPKQGTILELGAGRGQDSKYFAEQGYRVESTDLVIDDDAGREFPELVIRKTVDVQQPIPYEDESFDIVYAHLALHYFDAVATISIFDEVMRVLKPGGTFAFLVNSVNDPEYNTGEKIEDDYFETDGTRKRYFSQEAAREFGSKFNIVLCDEEGETYKDQAKGVHNLVRFVGKKT